MSLSTEIEAPQHWRWLEPNVLSITSGINGATISNTGDIVDDTFKSFSRWLDENDLKAYTWERTAFTLIVSDHSSSGENFSARVGLSYSYMILRQEDESNYDPVTLFSNKEKVCPDCDNTETEQSLICHNCTTCFYCICCGRKRDVAYFDPTNGMTSCESCGISCECGKFHSGYLATCSYCNPVFQCGNCRQHTQDELTPVTEDSLILCCQNCYNIYCDTCNVFTYEEIVTVNDDGLRRCNRCEYLGDDGDNEIFDEDSEMQATKLQLPAIPGREMIRLTGVEIEGGLGAVVRNNPRENGPNTLARALYDAGLSRNYRQTGYHHGEGFARVETDASCDWECVIGPINMARIADVRNLNNVVKIIKKTIKDGLLKLDLRCGTHIHVGAEKVSLAQAYNLHLMYASMEDTLYRLGAANWPIHRTLINDETHSAARSPKQTSKTKFARTFHNNRYYGLSFSNYFEKMLGDCGCGAARYGAFEECVCELHKCTFEFRLFNSTANTIKLHAYIALCQALVAKAISMPEIKNHETFPEFPFEKSRFRDMDGNLQNTMIEKWEENLRFIATELPLTDDEKKSIYYCIKNSELVKVDNAKELFKGETI